MKRMQTRLDTLMNKLFVHLSAEEWFTPLLFWLTPKQLCLMQALQFNWKLYFLKQKVQFCVHNSMHICNTLDTLNQDPMLIEFAQKITRNETVRKKIIYGRTYNLNLVSFLRHSILKIHLKVETETVALQTHCTSLLNLLLGWNWNRICVVMAVDMEK